MSDFLIYRIKTSVRVRVQQDMAGHSHCIRWSDALKMQLCAGYCSFVLNTDREGGMLCSAPYAPRLVQFWLFTVRSIVLLPS